MLSLLVILYCLATLCVINGSQFSMVGSNLNVGNELFADKKATDKVDTALYSRQLFVYGESAQIKLKKSHVLIIGNSSLAFETAKNLALAGVGNLYVDVVQPTDTSPSIIAEDVSLSQYLKRLNPSIQVCNVTFGPRYFFDVNI